MHIAQPPRAIHLLVLGVFIIALSAGLLGVNFGHHWDEAITINSVGSAICSGSFLPLSYYYPSVTHELYFLGLTPALLRMVWAKNAPSEPDIKTTLLIELEQAVSKLRARIVFLTISCLSILWVYILVWRWSRDWEEALLAAALLGFSWEVSYHSRFIASDALLMQFGALTAMFLAFHRSGARPMRWLRLAAVAAGFACGTKYQGALLLVPVLCAAYYDSGQRAAKGACWRAWAQVTSIFALTYLMTTPGTLFQPILFLSNLKTQLFIYAAQGHAGYTVNPPLGHLVGMLGYFSFAMFSRYAPVSFVFFALAVAGAILSIRKEKGKAAVFLSFPVLYICFMSLQRVMIVRNLLVLIPFFAIFAGRGFGFLRSGIRGYAARRIISVVVILLVLINAHWLLASGFSIRNKDKANYVAQLAGYLNRNPHTPFLLSKKISQALYAYDGKNRRNVTEDPSAKVKAAVFYASEVTPWERWSANRFNYTWRWFGPYEVNLNYYPSWAGDDRIVVMPISSALALGVF